MVDDVSAYLAIGLIASVTLMTRLAGAFAMRRVEHSPAIARFLDAMSIAVIAAIVATAVASGGLREAVAVTAAAATMLLGGGTIRAMLAGMIVAAGWTFAIG